jgi:pSer/pThr/pTyr-binding forkhead associated (FHA) protein
MPVAPPGKPAAPVASDDEETQFIVRDTEQPQLTLSRLAPSGHPGTIELRRAAYLLGRAPTCDIRLYSPSASREHARLTLRGDAWHLSPCEDKKIVVNGSVVRGEIRLEPKMRIQLGRDELLVIDPTVADHTVSIAAAATPSHASARPWWLFAVVLAVAAVAAAVVWFFMAG